MSLRANSEASDLRPNPLSPQQSTSARLRQLAALGSCSELTRDPVFRQRRPKYARSSLAQEITDATARLHGGPREHGGVVARGVVAANDNAGNRLLRYR